MPVTYHCDHCGAAHDLTDAVRIVSVQVWAPAPFPPGSRGHLGTAPDLIFHSQECLDAWLGSAGVGTPKPLVDISPIAQA